MQCACLVVDDLPDNLVAAMPAMTLFEVHRKAIIPPSLEGIAEPILLLLSVRRMCAKIAHKCCRCPARRIPADALGRLRGACFIHCVRFSSECRPEMWPSSCTPAFALVVPISCLSPPRLLYPDPIIDHFVGEFAKELVGARIFYVDRHTLVEKKRIDDGHSPNSIVCAFGPILCL